MRTKTPSRSACVIVAVLILTTAGTGSSAVYLAWFSSLRADQRIAAAAAVLTGGAFALAVLAGIVAVAAYDLAQRRPQLHLTASYRRGGRPKGSGRAFPSLLNVTLENKGTTAARNTAVRIRALGAMFDDSSGWIKEAPGDMRWESTADVALHAGGWPYPVPPINVRLGTLLGSDRFAIAYDVVADGFSLTNRKLLLGWDDV
jgi:hypothetical protein